MTAVAKPAPQPPKPQDCDDACGILGQWCLTCTHPEHGKIAAAFLGLTAWWEDRGAPDGQR